ncbi:SH3 domain-containing kinase-binding protein 1-like [Bombus flavifrons]|uniref:SH3 domain-containing kinase-binding protein 1-like n=1 Tax=Bombus flavifrons TaxID=103934 RepID=UPI0037049523
MEAIVEYNYEAQEPDELTLKKGDVITEIKVMLGGWWEGTLRDKRGMFPDNFVKVLEPLSSGTVGSTGSGGSEGAGSAKSEDVSLKNGGSKRRFCKVLFNYEPCNKDELTLVPQDSIEFLGEVEEGWWRGRLKGRVGVFPSNFVSPPVYEESDKHKDQESRRLCKVLFPYEAANIDELTLNEGDIITLLSTNASDKGWWIGELNGQVGLFPDNFVEVINVPSDHQDHEQKLKASMKSITKHSHQMKKNGKVHTRKSLDVKDLHADVTKKTISTGASSTTSTSPGIGGSGGERKNISGHSITSNLKRLVTDVGTNNGNGNTNIALGEELDGVERGEGAPLSHLTASRAKAPHRRPPSSQRLRRHVTGPPITTTTTTPEDNLANGNADIILEQLREEEPEGLAAKARRKAPWVEELKLNQLERRKIVSVDRIDKSEEKKERPSSRVLTTTNVADCINKLEGESEESRLKDKSQNQKCDTSSHIEQISSTPGTPPAYVPFALYNQLLERVVALEEKQAMLQQTMGQILEQFVPPVSSINSPD